MANQDLGLIRVKNKEELKEKVSYFLENPSFSGNQGDKAKSFIFARVGASTKYKDWIINEIKKKE